MLWTGEPNQLALQDYDRATEELLGLAKKTPGIAGVYRAGSVSVPGISDLDIVFVARDDARFSWTSLSTGLSEETLCGPVLHSPFIVPESVLPDLGFITDTRGMEHLWGIDLGFTKPSCPEVTNLLVSCGFATERLVSFTKALFCGRGKVRSALCQVNGLSHSFTLLGMAPPGVFARIRELRQNWFASGPERYDELLECLVLARDASLALLRIPWPGLLPASGRDDILAAGHWRFCAGDNFKRRPGPVSWLPKNGIAGEMAFLSTRFTVGVAPGLPGLLAGKLAPPRGAQEWRRHHEVIENYRRLTARHVGFSFFATGFAPRGWRRFVP